MSPDRIVYSTHPRPEPRCEGCGAPQSECSCPVAEIPPRKQTARLAHDRKRRRGKVVTVVSGLQLSEVNLSELARLLKNRCGAGGTVKDDEIEIQGEHRDKVAMILQELGYKTKLVGG
ncbi:translation initiation factor [Gloeobacter kilaueensis]|uniref:Translation initiation factor Sui1 n=1 Tax=Gloeobacter kilaueensis (strain ATCC BAA-2537 / CCAP 1431/1 / ULC 316 / JS1) TaxID=1183438 RepID=U5QP81_GLOK1|nr:translation initiation factor [Gloeobacter kilaueensis]AGY59379.1 translation initiation factor Sui1 [Gloeobacter kilaueensis JS1]